MTMQTRCKRCGRLFDLDRTVILYGKWRLCPDCRGPLPPTGGVPTRDSAVLPPWATEVA